MTLEPLKKKFKKLKYLYQNNYESVNWSMKNIFLLKKIS